MKAPYELREEYSKGTYTTYCEAVGWKAFNDNKLPTWEELIADSSKQKIIDAWRKVGCYTFDIVNDYYYTGNS